MKNPIKITSQNIGEISQRLINYLEAHDWILTPDPPDVEDERRYVKPSIERLPRVVIPITAKWSELERTFEVIAEQIAKVEKETSLEILALIYKINHINNSYYFKLDGTKVINHTIPMLVGFNLFKGVTELFKKGVEDTMMDSVTLLDGLLNENHPSIKNAATQVLNNLYVRPLEGSYNLEVSYKDETYIQNEENKLLFHADNRIKIAEKTAEKIFTALHKIEEGRLIDMNPSEIKLVNYLNFDGIENYDLDIYTVQTLNNVTFPTKNILAPIHLTSNRKTMWKELKKRASRFANVKNTTINKEKLLLLVENANNLIFENPIITVKTISRTKVEILNVPISKELFEQYILPNFHENNKLILSVNAQTHYETKNAKHKLTQLSLIEIVGVTPIVF